MDKITKEQRSKIMSKIKAKSKLEDMVSRELWKRGIRYRRNVRSLMGTPDFAIKKYKIVIFIDSCFWHFCPVHGKIPKSNVEFWEKKLNRNMERDREVNQYYEKSDWNLLRFWEHEVRSNLDGVVDSIENAVKEAKFL